MICTRCKKELPEEDFPVDKKTGKRRGRKCNTCTKRMNLIYIARCRNKKSQTKEAERKVR